MTTERIEKELPDPNVYITNRSKFTSQELLPYAGHWVAWLGDGTRVVAHHENLAEVVRMVGAAGLDRDEVIFDRIPRDGEGDLG